SADEQRMDLLTGEYFRSFMLHYNFPPFSVGEVKRMAGPSRRDIGHGHLAERGVSKVLPIKDEKFQYTIRIVSEVLESNGSSSMATVCGSSLALMDAGVPTKCHVGGVAMGLIKEGDRVAVLTDILGDEDHLGDMDFKVVGTTEGITSIQMDIKVQGLTEAILTQALEQARAGRLHILGKMVEAIAAPREDYSRYAPRIYTLQIKQDRIRDLIGPGGRNIRGVQSESGASVNVDDDGTVVIAATDADSAEKAIRMVRELTDDAEVGRTYMGEVVKVVEFGAFVRILPGVEGLVHISELSDRRVKRVEDVVREGDEILVKCIAVDNKSGKIRLSRREAMAEKEGGDRGSAQAGGDDPAGDED
ncbi:MAG TPA: polyribonucleotide nucleotidyltransferase, partial [Myxococcota bacterium]|nr:polyribonucleotide nucleotidyltransferase [Myxococcota bacterium]